MRHAVGMKGETPVHKLMTKDPTFVGPSTRLSQVQASMQQRGIHHMPVVEGGRFVGLLSANDMLRVALGDPYKQDPDLVRKDLELYDAREIMAEDVVTIGPHDTIREAARLLTNGSYHALPVVEDGKLVGIVTSTDLISYLVE